MSRRESSSRSSMGGGGGGVDNRDSFVDRRDSSAMDDLAALREQQQQEEEDYNNNNSDDDNAQLSGDEGEDEREDPLELAIDDLEGRVVAALDDFKLHSGVRTAGGATPARNIHEELAILLRPVLEVAAHTGPSVARTYHRGGMEGMEASMDDVYERIVSDLALPVLLEMARSDTIPAKRGASLEFFRSFWKECQKGGSWLDATTTGPAAGPYGGGGHGHQHQSRIPPAARTRRQGKRLAREGEILRYWVEASIACTQPGVFTSEEAEGAVASRGIIAASASLRPSLKHIVKRINSVDNRGANRLYSPVMKMVEGVLKKLFLSESSQTQQGESIRSASIKFLEIVVLCCSRKPKDVSTRRRGHNTMEDFSLEDLPEGHPFITKEALESIAEYAFTTLRGLTIMGGQVKIDVNLLSDMMLTTDGSPSAQVVSILKPAALAFLEIMSSVPKNDDDKEADEDSLQLELDRSRLDFDFLMSQKSYALTINAVSALGMHRPVFFKEASTCLAQSAYLNEKGTFTGALNRTGALAVKSQLKASCLTFLRNSLSVATGAWKILEKVLRTFDMSIQAEKALNMAKQAAALKTASRAARNRANMYYQWDTTTEQNDRVSKRQQETGDALARIRAAKAARGLGHGIQLPTSMSDAVELILLNLTHLPKKRPSSSSATAAASTKSKKTPATLDFVVDAIMTNGASLLQEEGRWYDRDGGTAWKFDMEAENNNHFQIDKRFSEVLEPQKGGGAKGSDSQEPVAKRRKLFEEQCQSAASDAISRIVANASNSRSKSLKNLGNQLAARLAFTLQKVKPSIQQQASLEMARGCVDVVAKKIEDKGAKEALGSFIDSYPLAAAGLCLEATAGADQQDLANVECSLSQCLLNEAFLLSCSSEGKENTPEQEQSWKYDRALELFVAAAVRAGELANEKPSDEGRKKAASQSAASLQREIVRLPRLTNASLLLISAMCDIEEVTQKAGEAQTKTSQENIAAAAAAHAAMAAAEKRATAALLILRDAAFQRDSTDTRTSAVNCAVAIASGRLPSTRSIQDKALKLTMNVLFAKNKSLKDCVIQSATAELEWAAESAIEAYDETSIKAADDKDNSAKNNLAPNNDAEKKVMDRMRKPAMLFMALCLRRPEIIKALFSVSCKAKADALSKSVRANMSKLSRGLAAKYGAAKIAEMVAEMTGEKETSMLLAFLDNLSSGTDKNNSGDDLIDACFKIMDSKVDATGKKDLRFIISVVSTMKRAKLVELLPQFVASDDKILLAALNRMGDRVGRQALLFRDEPDQENPSLRGMTLCEQLVNLHKLDFSALGIPQKRYLSAIKLCLEDVEVYNDRVLMSALDQMSGTFLTGAEKLPLAFMRTCILVCTKHESLHSWICHVLLPRLVEGKIHSDARQWEGWMRCAHMLEESGESGVSAAEAIQKLAPEQLLQYKAKWAGK